MSASIPRSPLASCFARASFVLFLPLLACCASKTTGPGGTLSGHVTLAAGQSSDVTGTAVRLYTSDPFVAGATPMKSVTSSGSTTNVAFSFDDVGHGDFYIVAWKDNLDGIVNAGDLLGWHNGGVNGTGQPVAQVLHLLHGQNATANISVSVQAAPQTGPGGGPSSSR